MLATKREWIAVGLAVSVVLLFYFWTASTSGGLPPWPMGRDSYLDHYNLLVHGILKGHLYLDVPVDPAMISARDPYDPKVWVPHGWMNDASFYHGHYYIYYGIIPALVFLLPFRLLTGGDLWMGTAGESVTVLAFLALVWLWLRIRRDHFPRTGAATAAAPVIGLGMAAGLLALARRPSMYEFAIASGCLFATLMLHSLYTAISSEKRTAWMAAAGVFLGLSFGCRPPLLFTILAPASMLLWLLLRERRSNPPWPGVGPAVRAAIGFSTGFGPIFVGLLAYNYLRFGKFLEFGFDYLLQDPRAPLAHIWGPASIWFNLRVYYTGALVWTRYFPFATLGVHPTTPRYYYASDDVFGILKYAPMVWFALASPLGLRSRSGAVPRSYAVVLGMALLCWIGPGTFDLFFGNSALRYMVDFLPYLALASFLGACALVQAASSALTRGLVRAAWVCSIGFSAAVAAVLSIPLEGSLVVQRGNAYYEKVARVLNVPTFWYERARGWHYGPISWHLAFPARPPHTVEKLVETPDASLLLEYLSGSRIRLGLQCDRGNFVLWGKGAGVVPGRISTLSASFGSLFPTGEHPYYLKHPFIPINRSTVYAELDNRPMLEGFRTLDPADCADIHIADGHVQPGWFSGSILSVERNRLLAHDLTAGFAPRSIRLVVPANLAPARWPLISAGSGPGGDLLFIETAPGGTARFGYFPSGSPPSFGSPFRLRLNSTLDCTVQMEQLAPSGRSPGGPRPLIVELGGRINWTSVVPYHPCGEASIHLGENTVAEPSVNARYPGQIQWVQTQPRLLPSTATDHLLLRVIFPYKSRWGLRDPLLFTGSAGSFDAVSVVHYGGGAGRFVLSHWGANDREAPILDSLDGTAIHEVEIITPVFSAPVGSPGAVRGLTIVRMDGREVLRFESEYYPAALTQAVVGESFGVGPWEKRFPGTILSQRWVGVPDRQ